MGIHKLFVAFTLLVFISCQKLGNEEPLKNDADLSPITIEVLNLKSLNAMKQGYVMLSTQEQKELWFLKYESIIKNDFKSLTKAQKEIVNQLYSILKNTGIKALKANPEKGDLFLQANLSLFEKHFTKGQLNLLIESPYYTDGFSILNADNYLSSIDQTVSMLAGDCSCRYDIGCGIGNFCDVENCEATSDGCGLFGTSRCIRRCSEANGPVLPPDA